MSHESYTAPQQPKEIERKFLVNRLPENLDSCDNSMIRQGYVHIGDDGSEVRVRSKSMQYFLTGKSDAPDTMGGMVRTESELQISKKVFDMLWPTTAGKQVEKVRFVIPYHEHDIELDIYLGELNGLVTAEVEFEDEATAIAFTPPDWLGEDITKNKAYKNQNLAQHGKPQ